MKRLVVAGLLFSPWLAAGLGVAEQNEPRPVMSEPRPVMSEPRPAQALLAEAPQAQPTTEKAEAEIGAGRIDEALNTLKAIPRTGSNESLINHLLGLAHYQKSDYAGAVEFLALSAAASPESSKQHRQAIRLLGMSHYLSGHVAEAIPYLEQIRTWDHNDVETQYVLGNAYIQAHAVDKAREAFAAMFSVAPSSAGAYLINAQMMIRQQLEELAEIELRKALELDPRLPEGNFLLAEMAIYHANVDLGITLLEKEIAINPAFAMAYYRLGEALTRQLKWTQAIAPLQKSIWLNPFFSGPYIVLGKVYLKTGDLANAESTLRRALKMDPNNFSGHHMLAQVLQQAGKSGEAKREFELADRLRTDAER
jgi:tetratricopeptide (TPR) repeat protein